MRNLPQTPRSVLAATLALFLIMAIPAGSFTLCVGEEGHAALETQGAACCVAPSTSNPGRSASLVSSDCGTCRDVPIGVTDLHRTRDGAHLPLSLTSTIVHAASLEGPAAPNLSGFSLLSSSGRLRSTLKSPILRC